MPFLSLYDDRARPKGSRDPLGFEVVWSHFGRRLVGNLTTITSSLINFKVALLGFVWAHELAESAPVGTQSEVIWQTFLRYEQLVAYLRLEGGAQQSLMGINQAQINFRTLKTGGSIILSANQSAQILSNQASYGLWGLYSTALREAGLLSGADRKPTTHGNDIVKKMLSGANSDFLSAMHALIRTDAEILEGQLTVLSQPFCEILTSTAHDEELVKTLLTHTLQEQTTRGVYESLYRIARNWMYESASETSGVSGFLAHLHFSENVELKTRAADILKVERVMVLCNTLFDFLRSQNGCTLNSAISRIADSWPQLSEGLPSQLPDTQYPRSVILTEILKMAVGPENLDALARKLLAYHKTLMKERDGAAWLYVDSHHTIRVKIGKEDGWLPDPSGATTLESIWHYDYFLGSYLSVMQQAHKLPEPAVEAQ